MIRTSARLTTLLAATALLGGAIAVNCSKGTDNTGVVRLALQVPPNFTINSVHWQIMSATNTLVKQGNIDTSNINATASVDTSCPAGTGYTVVMSANATDTMGGTVPCNGTSAPFNLQAGGSFMIGLTLTCGGGTPMQGNGSVIATANVIAGDNCPLLTNWEASPLQTTSGANINVSATATDADTATGQTISYAWTATAAMGTETGTFAMPTASSTTYACGAAGDHTLTVTVSDSFVPPCTTAMNFPVHCVAAGVCGNMVIEPGEQCDPPSVANHCSTTCQNVPFCGDGHIDPGETCDPPNGTTCSATCQTQAFCGNGIIEAGEQCDPPGPLPTPGETCNAMCQISVMCTSNACITCEMADTADCPMALNKVPGGTGCWGCEGFAPGSKIRTDCQALYSCIRSTNCMNADDTTPCLCGTLSASTCASSGPPTNAPCAAQYAAAASDTPGLGPVTNQTSNPTSAVGMANNQAVCAVDSALAPGACVCP